MMPRAAAALLALLLLAPSAAFADPVDDADAQVDAPVAATQKHHHHHHHKHHHKHHRHHHHPSAEADDRAPAKAEEKAAEPAAPRTPEVPAAKLGDPVKRTITRAKAQPVATVATGRTAVSDKDIMSRMKTLEGELTAKEKVIDSAVRRSIRVNGPLPADFNDRFASAVGQATHSDPSKVKVVGALPAEAGVVQVLFEAPKNVADATTDEAADPDSALANGILQSFLVEKAEAVSEPADEPAAEVPSNRIDVNTAMPFGDLEPFGREDTGQELTEQSISESNEMVDQLERAEVAEEKRAVFRALTRLRGAAITSFDGIARSQTGNIDEYNKVNKWRKAHPLHHLADEESDVKRWAFPDTADF